MTIERSPLEGIRLVALDLDGTLLPESKVLTPRATEVVAALGEAGIAVTLATGKGWSHTARYADELGLETPLVALEGAYVARSTTGGADEIAARTVPLPVRAGLQGVVDDIDLGWFYTHREHRTRVHRRLEHRLDQIAVWDPHVEVVDDGLHEHAADPFVVHLVGEPERVAEAHDRVRELDLTGVELFHVEFWDGYDQIQVRPTGIGKHAGLLAALDHLGIASSELLAAGDWLNDVEMLGMAQVAVTFAHAHEPVRRAADIVLDGSSEDDAVIEFLAWSLDRL